MMHHLLFKVRYEDTIKQVFRISLALTTAVF